MRKLLVALSAAVMLALAPVAQAADENCYPVADAKAQVAAWDKNAYWEVLTEGPAYEALVKWVDLQLRGTAGVANAVVVSKATNKQGQKVVMFALSADGGKCVNERTYSIMTPEQYAQIIGNEL